MTKDKLLSVLGFLVFGLLTSVQAQTLGQAADAFSDSLEIILEEMDIETDTDPMPSRAYDEMGLDGHLDGAHGYRDYSESEDGRRVDASIRDGEVGQIYALIQGLEERAQVLYSQNSLEGAGQTTLTWMKRDLDRLFKLLESSDLSLETDDGGWVPGVRQAFETLGQQVKTVNP